MVTNGFHLLLFALPMETSYLTSYLPEVITMLNFVHHSLAFKHFITTYVHLKTLLLVSFGAETVLCSYTLSPRPPSSWAQTTFPSLLCSSVQPRD